MSWDKVLFGKEDSPAYTPQADSYQVTEEEMSDKKKQRELSLASNPHYIKAGSSIIGPGVEANSIGTTSTTDMLNKPINLSIPIILDTPPTAATATAPVVKEKKSKKGE